MAGKKEFKFDREGVVVRIPEQARRLRAVSLPVDPLDKMPAAPGGFQPHRVVINVALEDEDNPGEFVEVIEVPFELRVRYTRGDLERLQREGGALRLAFWDGSQWVVFTPEKHSFELQPSDQGDGGGYGVVRISHWGDPNVSWGK
jgi:hypothetical protein